MTDVRPTTEKRRGEKARNKIGRKPLITLEPRNRKFRCLENSNVFNSLAEDVRNENLSQAKFSISQAKLSLRGRKRSQATPRYERCAFSSSGAVHPGRPSADNHRRRRLDARLDAGHDERQDCGAARLGNFWASPKATTRNNGLHHGLADRFLCHFPGYKRRN